MISRFNILLILITTALVQFPSAFAGTDHLLFIDGKLRFDGVSSEGARIIVERDGLQINVINNDIGRVRIPLQLQHVYLLSFERPGCLTKQLLFDTNVPDGSEKNYSFPFLVTLEKRELDPRFRYAQPVGYIRYYPDKDDFGYDTNYALERERAAKKRRSVQYTPNDVTMDTVTFVDMEVKKPTPNNERVDFTTVSGSSTGGKVNFLDHKDRSTIAAKTAVRPNSKVEPLSQALHGQLPEPELTKAHPALEQARSPDGRSEQVLVEKAYVALVTRITEKGHTREYRKVEHRYGDVHYFCDGSSCGPASYDAATR